MAVNISKRLKYARTRAGLTLTQVRERSDIGESSVSEFENGHRDPSVAQLAKLAKTYNRSVSFFLGDDPVLSERVLWRLRPDTGAEAIETHFLRLCEQYANLERWTGCGRGADLPQPPARDAGDFDFGDARKLAKLVRDEFQFGDRPGPCLHHVLEEVCCVKIFHLRFQPTGTAASTVSESVGRAVLLNAGNIAWRRTFDLAHELFHLLTWNLFHAKETDGTVATDREEKLATCFASNFLMPTDAVQPALEESMQHGRIRFESLFDVARQFDVSVEALLWRMHFLYSRSEERTRADIEAGRVLAPRLEERERIDPRVYPARYRAVAIRALKQGEISIGRFAEYLDMSRQDAMRYAEQEATDAEEVQVAPG